MTTPSPGTVEQAAEAHAQHLLTGDLAAVQQDCSASALQEPTDLYQQLGMVCFERYAILGHAKIGFHHVFKIRYFGPITLTLHHRFGMVDGTWRVLESARV